MKNKKCIIELNARNIGRNQQSTSVTTFPLIKFKLFSLLRRDFQIIEIKKVVTSEEHNDVVKSGIF